MDQRMRSSNVYKENEYVDGCQWTKAIQEAFVHAFTTKEDESTEYGFHRVHRSLVYLEELRRLLEKQEFKDWAPHDPSHPPFFDVDPKHHQDDEPNLDIPLLVEKRTIPGRSPYSRTNPKSKSSSLAKKKKAKRTKKKQASISENRYAMIAFDSDDGSSDIGTENNVVQGSSKIHPIANIEMNLSAEADPYVPSLSFGEDDCDGIPPHQPNCHRPSRYNTDTTRLLIRLYASKSDLHAKMARLLGSQRRWLLGTGELQSSIVSLANGREMADTAISALLGSTNNDHSTGHFSPQDIASFDPSGVPSVIGFEAVTDYRREQLEKDAEIISVSTRYLISEKSRYLKTANNQVRKLERILQPMWKARDAAKKRIGAGKWNANKKSEKSLTTKARLKHERELLSLEEALKQLQGGQVDTSFLVEETSYLHKKLKQIRFTKNRYNGHRPTRLSPITVIDPQSRKIAAPSTTHFDLSVDEYGWTFTGSIGGEDCVQFFEKWIDTSVGLHHHTPRILGLSNGSNEIESASAGSNIDYETLGSFVLVKLDFHSLTGEIQTVVEYPAKYNDEGIVVHHAWSSTMNFKQPVLYRQILMDPLSIHRMCGGTNVAKFH